MVRKLRVEYSTLEYFPRIIAFLRYKRRGYMASEISRGTGINYKAVRKACRIMEELGILRRERGRRRKMKRLYWLSKPFRRMLKQKRGSKKNLERYR